MGASSSAMMILLGKEPPNTKEKLGQVFKECKIEPSQCMLSVVART
jgi:hypothetical protein